VLLNLRRRGVCNKNWQAWVEKLPNLGTHCGKYFDLCTVSKSVLFPVFHIINALGRWRKYRAFRSCHCPLCCFRPFLWWGNSPCWDRTSSLLRIYDRTQTHQTRQDSSGRVISRTQRPVPDNTQQTQETDSHAPVGFQPAIPTSERPTL
jgi:hypothetical protein